MARNTTRTATPATATAEPTNQPTPNEETIVTTNQTPAPADPATDQPTPDQPGPFAALIAEYPSADMKRKAAIRADLDAALMAAVAAGDLAAAQSAMSAKAALAPAKKAAPEIDYEALVRSRVAGLALAAHMILAGDGTPDGLPESYAGLKSLTDDESKIVLDGMRGIMALVDVMTRGQREDVRDVATALASAKVGTARAAKRDLAAHIVAVMTPGKFYTCTMIANGTSEVYGDEHPSSGAVAARLFAKGGCTVDGVTPYKAGATLPDGRTAPADGAIFTA